MGKRSRRPDSGGYHVVLLGQCALFWVAPVLFLTMTILTVSENRDPESDLLATVLLPFLALVTFSIARLAVDCLLVLGRMPMVMQVVAQLAIILSIFGQSRPVTTNVPEKKLLVQSLGKSSQTPQSSPGQERVAKVNGSQRDNAGVEGAGRISVVLPCLNETDNAIRTVQSFCDRTPADVLHEIIVVDDGSSPPLSKILYPNISKRCRLSVLRHEDGPRGLMSAKQTGGDAAKGQFIGFYDCHVAPRKGWHKEPLDLLRMQPRRLVIPMIGELDVSKWDEVPGGNLVSKCYVNWNADWWWYDDDSDYTPVISGGLVATTRKWWRESGGFDPGMHGWGGENTEQPIRTWLCGGDVLRAQSSVIAHMWRRTEDSRTIARYSITKHYDNVARVAAAWFDEFKHKFREGGLDPNLNVSKTLRLKRSLGCKPFAFFLFRFRKLYLNGGLLPDKVFKIRSQSKRQCVQRRNEGMALSRCEEATWFHLANMIPGNFPSPKGVDAALKVEDDSSKEVVCGGHKAMGCAACPQGNGAGWCNADCGWVFGKCVPKGALDTIEFQPAGQCCSGIRQWDSLDCWENLAEDGPRTQLCDITGGWSLQNYLFLESGLIWHSSGKCLGVDPSSDRLTGVDCSHAERWERADAFEPSETRTYHLAVRKHGYSERLPDH